MAKAKRDSPVRFFFKHAGWSYDPAKESSQAGRWRCAKALASAEAWARETGVRYQWQTDDNADRSGIAHDSPLWQCVAIAGEDVVESLSGIDLGSNGDPWMSGIPGGGSDYARVVEAELAGEIRHDAERANR